MAKTRVSVLAKELGLELKDFTAHLDKLGIRGKKSQSTLEDDEVARWPKSSASSSKTSPRISISSGSAERSRKAPSKTTRSRAGQRARPRAQRLHRASR